MHFQKMHFQKMHFQKMHFRKMHFRKMHFAWKMQLVWQFSSRVKLALGGPRGAVEVDGCEPRRAAVASVTRVIDPSLNGPSIPSLPLKSLAWHDCRRRDRFNSLIKLFDFNFGLNICHLSIYLPIYSIQKREPTVSSCSTWREELGTHANQFDALRLNTLDTGLGNERHLGTKQVNQLGKHTQLCPILELFDFNFGRYRFV